MKLALVSFTISLILFWTVNIPLFLFDSISLLIVAFFVCMYYRVSKNDLFWKRFLIVAFTNVAAYLTIRCLKEIEPGFSIPRIIFSLYILWLLVIFGIRNHGLKTCNQKKENKAFLFPDRLKDLECLERYIRLYNVVGLNAKWGDGKTFLINKLKMKLSNEYYFITIEVLASTIDSIENYIIDEISYLLEKNGIYPSSSLKMKRFFEKSNYGWLNSFFEKNDSYDKMMDSLVYDLEKLDKPLVLNFEDVDRISSCDLIMKIFSLTEKLSKSPKIKVIFQYDNRKLLNILNQDYVFLEKYIPHEVNLTRISFLNQLKLSCSEKKLQDFPLDIVRECSAILVPDELQFLFLIDNIVNLLPKDFSIRRTEHFIMEVSEALSLDCFKKNQRIVVAYYLMKFFYDEVFSEFVVGRSFIDTCRFEYFGKKISILQMLHDDKYDINNQKKYTQNELPYSKIAFICLFGYHLDVFDKKNNSLMYENENFLKHIDENEHIDRILWKLHCFGHSSYTDMENAVKAIKNEVLLTSQKSEEKKKSFDDVANRLLSYDFENGHNGSIFKLGNPRFANVFQAFNIYETDSNIWIKLIDFYFEYEETKEIDRDLIVTFMYANVSSRKVFCYLLERFNQLNVVGNFGKTGCYKLFMEKFLNAIVMHRFCFAFRGVLEDMQELNVEFLSKFIKQEVEFINEEKIKTIPKIQKDLELVIKFLEKNIKIMECINTIDTTPFYGTVDIVEPNNTLDYSIFKGKSLEEVMKILDDGYEKEIYSKKDVDSILEWFRNTQIR